jgi:hypothetical protein
MCLPILVREPGLMSVSHLLPFVWLLCAMHKLHNCNVAVLSTDVHLQL